MQLTVAIARQIAGEISRRLQGKGQLIPTLAQQFAFARPRPRPRSLFRSIQRFHNPLVLELLGSSRQVPHAQVTRQC